MIIRLFVLALAMIWASVAAAQSNYQIQTGDQLTIEVLEDPSLNRQALVLPDGSISFPLVGSIRARGKSTDRFQSELSAALGPNFAAPPSVFVSVAALAVRDTDELFSRFSNLAEKSADEVATIHDFEICSAS